MDHNTFKFFDTTGKHITINYCNFHVKVKYLESDIELNFSYDYFTPDDESGCPFNQIDRKYFGHKNGVVIHRNSLTELLVEYLLMDYTELSQYTGSITPMAYKLIVLKSICELW